MCQGDQGLDCGPKARQICVCCCLPGKRLFSSLFLLHSHCVISLSVFWFKSLIQVQNSGQILMEAQFLCSFVRYHALKTFYPFLSFNSSTDHLWGGFAPSLILSVQTCLYPASHVTDPSGTESAQVTWNSSAEAHVLTWFCLLVFH